MKRFAAILLMMLTAAFLIARGIPEADANEITISGRLSIKGNDPFAFLAITTGDAKVYAVEGDLTEELKRHQGKGFVTISGTLTDESPPWGVIAVIRVTSYTLE